MKLHLFMIFAALCFLLPWPINAYKLSNCDFKSDYKCEVLHGVGVIMPPTAIITVWFGSDAE